jgi:hypothetical protein
MVVRECWQVYQRVLSRLAQGLLHEERRVRYLSNEVGTCSILSLHAVILLSAGVLM